MTLNEYQAKAMTTRMEACNNFSYMMLNLVAEVGEFAGKIAKSIRKEDGSIYNNDFTYPTAKAHTDNIPELRKEAGDILWQLAGLCDVMGWKLESIAEDNLAKLADRKKLGVIDGNGDNR